MTGVGYRQQQEDVEKRNQSEKERKEYVTETKT